MLPNTFCLLNTLFNSKLIHRIYNTIICFVSCVLSSCFMNAMQCCILPALCSHCFLCSLLYLYHRLSQMSNSAVQCSVLPVCLCNTQCVLSALMRRQSNAGTPCTNWGRRMPNICHSQLLPTLSILEGCQSRYDSFVHCIKPWQHFWPADLSSRQRR